MDYREARKLSRGQEFAKALPLEDGPTKRPVPGQPAMIRCAAPVVPYMIDQHNQSIPPDQVEVFIKYKPRPDTKCSMVKPDCISCQTATVARRLNMPFTLVSKTDFEKGIVDQFMPQLE